MTFMLGGDERLCKQLIPEFPLGLRRMTPGHAYLQALTKPNVAVKSGGMTRFVPEGLVLASGEILKVDAIICATGFDTSFRPRFPLIGRNGNLQEIWRKELPKSYMSCAVQGLPNYFSKSHSTDELPLGSVYSHVPSIPRPQRPHRPWQRIYRKRAHRQVYHGYHQKVPNRRYQGHLSFPRCRQ